MAFGPASRSDSAAQLPIMGEAGRKLKRIRERRRLKYRDVEGAKRSPPPAKTMSLWCHLPVGWFDELPVDANLIELRRTNVVGFSTRDREVQVPVALDPGIDSSKAEFLSRMIQRWGTLPAPGLAETGGLAQFSVWTDRHRLPGGDRRQPAAHR
jgi:hypothetical protein